MTLVTIQGAHTFDLAIAVLGKLASFSALATTQYLQVKMDEDAALQLRTPSDHVFRRHSSFPVLQWT